MTNHRIGVLEHVDRIVKGPLPGWLREHVHGLGAKPGIAELVEQATGGALAVEPFLEHLRARYLG